MIHAIHRAPFDPACVHCRLSADPGIVAVTDAVWPLTGIAAYAALALAALLAVVGVTLLARRIVR